MPKLSVILPLRGPRSPTLLVEISAPDPDHDPLRSGPESGPLERVAQYTRPRPEK